jgi:AraC family transcriptional regulator
MTNHKNGDYFCRIRKVIDYIHEHPENELSLSECSKLSCFSPYHFHRIFRAIVGESPGMYQRRVRLEQAAYLLKYNKSRTITDIALSLGFESSSAFSRAYKHQFNCTPGQTRKSISNELKKTVEARKISDKPKEIINVEIDVLKDVIVFVRRYTGTYHDFAVQNEWRLHIKDAMSKGYITSKSRYYGIVYDDPECTDDLKCRYDCCISVDKAVPEDVKIIPGGKHALFTIAANIADDPFPLYQWIYGFWLPTSGYEVRDTECYNDYFSFVAGDGSNGDNKKVRYKICLPVNRIV